MSSSSSAGEGSRDDGSRAKDAGVEVVVPPTGDRPLVVRIESGRPRSRWWSRLLGIALIASLIANVSMYSAYEDYFAGDEPPIERYHSGSRTADERIAVIEIAGTIMPPYTSRWIDMIEHARDDENVKGVLLVVDSPGGLVADSHQIYHALVELRESGKPIVVSMRRIAASGGLYVAMGAGPDGTIYAEPTTWTGSIGVIVPHWDLSKFAKWNGIGGTHPALKTGELKDSLSPLRPLSERDVEVWTAILDDSFDRFIGVIAENRNDLDEGAVETLATGQIYTAVQAEGNGLVDTLGFEEDALDELRTRVGIDNPRVVSYEFEQGLFEMLTGTVEASDPRTQWRDLMESTVPRAMYYCSWAPFYPAGQ